MTKGGVAVFLLLCKFLTIARVHMLESKNKIRYRGGQTSSAVSVSPNIPHCKCMFGYYLKLRFWLKKLVKKISGVFLMVKAPSGVSVNTLKRIRSFSFNSLAFSSYYDLASVDIGWNSAGCY